MEIKTNAYNILRDRAKKLSENTLDTTLNVSKGISSEIYFYNISTVQQVIKVPPTFPEIIFNACPRNDYYVNCNSITDPYPIMNIDNNNIVTIIWVDGKREATKLLNPMNPGIDQDWTESATMHQGRNLNAYGIFWSENPEPTFQELKKARKRLEKTYTDEINKLNNIANRDLEDALMFVNDISRAAAQYYGLTPKWILTKK